MLHYDHQPLSAQGTIRVLHLEPATDFKAPLRCKLINVSLAGEGISYEALSYAWGSAVGTYTLNCEGRELPITRNCESALRHLRFKFRARILWVDAICIDQKSISERERQVQIMDDIFSKAVQVLIWLGESDYTTAMAFAFIKIMCSWYWRPFSGVTINDLNWKWNGNVTLANFHRDFMVALCSRPWFKRVWTMQELILSRHGLVICGREMMPWADFAAGADMFWSYWEYRNIRSEKQCQGLYHRFWCWEVFQKIPTDPGELQHLVAYLLLSSRSQESSDPKDKIIALFSLVRKLGFRLSSPDYARPASKLYEDAVNQYIRQYGSLFLVEQSLRSSRIDPSLPTWVPSFNREVPFSPLILATTLLPSTCKPDINLLSQQTPGTLPLRGKLLAHITRISPGTAISRQSTHDPPHHLTTDRKFNETLQVWCAFVSQLPCLPEGETYMSALAHLLSGPVDIQKKVGILPRPQSEPVDPNETPPRPYRTYCERFHSSIKGPTSETHPRTSSFAAVKRLLDRQQSRDSESIRSTPDEDLAIQVYICRSISEQRLVLTSSKHLGRGPSIVQEKDLIVLFAGARVPFVIRPAGHNYEFVGPVEVHGIPSESDWDLGDVRELEIFTLV